MDVALQNSRISFSKLGRQYEPAVNILVEKEMFENVNCYWLYRKPREFTKKQIVVYLHGGCFALGSLESHRALVSHFADRLDLPFLFIEYSLAPENKYPTAVHEILKIYESLCKKNQALEIVLMGDSAGAGLATSVTSVLNKKGLKKPTAIVMISPWVDLRNKSHSMTVNASIDPILTKEQMDRFTKLYVEGNDLSEANPIQAFCGPFPKTLIIVGSNEILLDDSHAIFQKIRSEQPVTKLTIYDGQTHVWLLDNIASKSSTMALNEISKFLAG